MKAMHTESESTDSDRGRSTASQRKRAAMTLVELLVVIAVVGLLVALLLPAVQAARAAGRRIECVNNLRQHGFASIAYHETYRVFPSGGQRRDEPGPVSVGWRVEVLPYLELVAVYDAIGPQHDGGPTNREPRKQVPGVLVCPSAENRTLGDGTELSNYFGVNGAGIVSRAESTSTVWGGVATDGVVYPGSNIASKDVTDGLSKTVLLGERNYVLHSWLNGMAWTPPSRLLGYSSKNLVIPLNASHTVYGYWYSDGLAPSGGPYSMAGNDLMFGSEHAGGANFCLGDGSVRFLTDDTGLSELQLLAARNDGWRDE